MAALDIRAATPADLALVAALGRRTYVEHYASMWQPDALATWLETQFGDAAVAADLAAPDVRYDLGFAGGAAVGFAKTRRDRPVDGRPDLIGLELQKIYFLASATGHGYGSALLAHVLARADAAGEPRVWLDVLQSNRGGRRLYERFGFRVVGERHATMPPAFSFFVMVREPGATSAST